MVRHDPVESLELPIPAQPHPYLARMARFTNGDEHGRRRRAVVEILPSEEGLEVDAFSRTAGALEDRLDVMPILSSVPASILAERLGCGDVIEEIALLCDEGVVSEGLPDIVRTSILFQCRDATAALAVMGLTEHTLLEEAVPVRWTQRVGPGWVSLSKVPFGAGSHACPGRAHALALAAGMVAALASHRVVERGPDRGRPNMSLPRWLIMERNAT
jgi:hypothetical protein